MVDPCKFFFRYFLFVKKRGFGISEILKVVNPIRKNIFMFILINTFKELTLLSNYVERWPLIL